jgi:hypothetical protein
VCVLQMVYEGYIQVCVCRISIGLVSGVVHGDTVLCVLFLLMILTNVCVCRYVCVHISSPADELSCECRDQAQGVAQEAAGCLLRQVSVSFSLSDV